MSLKGKRALFPAEYIKDRNATQAAIRCGYAEKSAGQQAEVLMRNHEIQVEIMLLSKERSQTSGIDAAWLLNRLADVANVRISDIFNESGGMIPVHEMPDAAQFMITGIKTKEITNIDGDNVGYAHEIKLDSRAQYLSMIGKHVDVAALRERIDAHFHDVPTVITRDMTAPPIRSKVEDAQVVPTVVLGDGEGRKLT